MIFVEQVMTSPVTRVEPWASIEHAGTLLRGGRNRPRRWRRTACWSQWYRTATSSSRAYVGSAAALLRVEAIMRRGVVTAAPGTPVEEASRLMLEHKIGALPVLDGDRLVGIVSGSELFRMLTRVLGVTERSTRLPIELTAPTRQLAEVSRIASEHG